MQNFKFIVFSVVVLFVMGLVGYWAVVTIEPGDINIEKEKQKELKAENKELQKEVKDLKDKLALLEADSLEKLKTPPAPENPSPAQPSKYRNLINDLQKLADNKVFLKEKSRGTAVGTIQTFLNVYNGTNKRVDNDYGAGTKTDVMNFQKAEGLSADGEAGPNTFLKMIDWLKENS
ncbi:MAG: N-acetylmuramoyl-L-alanine amidase cwlL [Candidatus Nomurabacteria bacterium GW2011_GWF2_43_8]|uniref:N-acetylmuramoyl-L-alanine amidase cwlL n=3 Tax=Candidatus Nomuraibacteriota TaxID=1752729 RepID=A0A0G1FQA2_9BACT|nr:MAG: N-acetylmuramoyl-L-alanine amidase cwlL [Candidatus Nomurabacteria bacterium GW2011_GWA2_43_15]KKT24661.1 MAG: N-acetylmuramoyl-L-alanine amidase cwlL [Candidatus Nomurabacteria bacterium GW2011_GWF2_43_8]